jgi:hypothetical protein
LPLNEADILIGRVESSQTPNGITEIAIVSGHWGKSRGKKEGRYCQREHGDKARCS